MTEDEIENGLTSPSLEIRKSFAENKDIFRLFNSSQIERGLADKSPIIRYIFIKLSRECYKKITPEQYKIAQKDKNQNVRALAIQHSNKFGTEDIDNYLKDPAIEVKLAIASNRFIKLTKKRIKFILKSEDKRIIKIFVEKIREAIQKDQSLELLSKLNMEQRSLFVSAQASLASRYEMESGLIHRYHNIRASFAQDFFLNLVCSSINRYNPISHYQLDRGLRDDSVQVRRGFLNRNFSLYSIKQVERCSKDEDMSIRRCIFNATDITLTDEQIKRGLNDSSDDVVASVIESDYSLKFLDIKTIEKISMSRSYKVKKALVEKPGVTFTDEQIERLINDNNPHIQWCISKNASIKFTDDQIEMGLTSKNSTIRGNFARRFDFKPNKAQVDRGIIDSSSNVRNSFIKRRNIKLSEEQIDIIIGDDNYANLWGLLTRDDITLTSIQIKRLLKYTGKELVKVLKKRSDYIEYQKNKKESKPSKGFNRI